MKGRRLFLAGVAAILPSAMALSAAQPAQNAPASQFAPPSAPLVLTRTVWRALHDGKQIVIQRRYRLRIIRHGDGFKVDGELIDCSVEAPPSLAALAEMERSRPDEALFPVQLDASGRILANPAPEKPRLHRQGGREAMAAVRNSAIANPDKAQAASLIDQIVNAGGVAPWPSDLFHPARPEQREQRRIALPGGGQGDISVTIAAHGLLQGGLPRLVERTVVTELDGTRKVSREQWTIETK